MTIDTLPRATATATAPVRTDLAYEGTAARTPRPGFWHAPFAAPTFRTFGYVLTSLPVAVAGFVFAVTLFSLGAGLAVTLLGMPVFAAMSAGARGLGAGERRRARSLLGLDVAEPAPVRTADADGAWARIRAQLRDAAGWKALLFQVVMFPWRVASFVLSVTVWVVGWALALFPTYSWVFSHYLDWPGYRVFDFESGGEHYAYYIESPWQVAGVSALGVLVVLLTPLLLRALTGVDRSAVRGLLGR
ncbi:sensor domain-containing protein [Streptomyces aureocirculatus]|uniref:sensor domain-containing protein n=1 Tax=Streptomyces aureocirculatus TaxID=67275 RepID=UPI00068C5367|nr:sensor domain-containing protein [Streptomyces aureocirculatus]